MAILLKLVRAGTTLNFQGGATGMQLLDDGYLPRVAVETPGRVPPPVSESLRLRVKGVSHDNLATFVQSLSKFQRWAKEYQADQNAFRPVWLHAQMLNESNTRVAIIWRISWEFVSSQYAGAPSAGNRQMLVVSFKRGPYFEAIGTANFATTTPSALVSVVYDPTSAANIKGDAPGRCEFTLKNTTAAVTLDKAWVGVRSSVKHETAANLQHIWEVEMGTLGTDAALIADVTASDIFAQAEQKATITPGTTTWVRRMTIRMAEIVNIAIYPDLREQFGLFTWLLRTKLTAGEWEVKLRFGYDGMATGDLIEHAPVLVTETSWTFKNMGVQSIPVRDGHVAIAFSAPAIAESFHIVEIWARRTSGAGTLDLDCLVEIPIDEGYLFINEKMNADQNEPVTFRETDLGKMGVSTQDTGGKIKAFPPFEVSPFRMPPGDIRLFIAYAQAALTDITDTAEMSGKYHAAYRSLRGND